MNIFINFVKKSLARKGTKDGVGALQKIKVLLLPALDLLAGPWAPASSFCSSRIMVKKLIQELHWLMHNLEAIVMEDLNKIFPNVLTNLLDIKLLEL